MRKKILLISLVCLITLTVLALAQIPSPLKEVKVSTIVSLDDTTGIYTYNYTIFNPPLNNGQIHIFHIDITMPSYGKELSSEGLIIQRGVNYQGTMLSRSFNDEIMGKGSLLEKPVIPIGAQVPLAWSASITVMSTVMWGADDEQHLIMPGQSLDGFSVLTHGLPGIRDAIIKPDIDYDNLPKEYWENVELTKQLEDNLTYRTKTLGPTAPPVDFKPISFIDYIITMKHEAFSLGWITNQGIEQSLDAKLDNAKMEIAQGNTNTAKNILAAFINEVEAQKDKYLTSESYGLLKYNVQYLIGKL